LSSEWTSRVQKSDDGRRGRGAGPSPASFAPMACGLQKVALRRACRQPREAVDTMLTWIHLDDLHVTALFDSQRGPNKNGRRW
ncbi:MAG TPA: hypothetical protein VKJ77_04110, partial [Caballeronia sp.]|nr:hypothetical protein [Caballeronia sp.]